MRGHSRFIMLLLLSLLSFVLLSACGSNEPAGQQANSATASPAASPEETPEASDEAVQEQGGKTDPPQESEAPADTPESSVAPAASPAPKATDPPGAEPSGHGQGSGHTSGKDDDTEDSGQGPQKTAAPKPTAKATPPAESTASDEPEPAVEVHTVEIVNFAFSPAELTIKPGDSVKFINKDEVGHTATADDSSFDTGMLDQDQEKEITFTKDGEFSYYCMPHPGMKGKIIVAAE